VAMGKLRAVGDDDTLLPVSHHDCGKNRLGARLRARCAAASPAPQWKFRPSRNVVADYSAAVMRWGYLAPRGAPVARTIA
jgi:hypothetical protein